MVCVTTHKDIDLFRSMNYTIRTSSYPESISLCTLKAYNAINWPEGATISFCMLALALTCTVYLGLYIVNVYWCQWRIQDFPDGVGAPTPEIEGSKNLLFGKIFAQKCMKMRGRTSSLANPLDPPMDVMQRQWQIFNYLHSRDRCLPLFNSVVEPQFLGGTNPRGRGLTKLLFDQNFFKTAWKQDAFQ